MCHYKSSLGSMKSRLQNVNSQYHYVYWKVLTLVLLGIGGHFPQLLTYEDSWSINSMLKELCCVTDAVLDVLRVEL